MRTLHLLLVVTTVLLPHPTLAHEPNMGGAPKDECETGFATVMHEYGPPSTGFLIFLGMDGSVPPCPYGDGTWDGHPEFAFGGAFIQAAASACTEAYADHAPGGTIGVYDAGLSSIGADVAFGVYSDTLNNNPIQEEPNCGDFESDYGVDCVNSCDPAFPPGLDGSYQVYVSGTTGHVYAQHINFPGTGGLP